MGMVLEKYFNSNGDHTESQECLMNHMRRRLPAGERGGKERFGEISESFLPAKELSTDEDFKKLGIREDLLPIIHKMEITATKQIKVK